MEQEKQRYDDELKGIYDKYEKELKAAASSEDVFDIGVGMQKEMTELNIKYRYWDETKGYDHDSIYYTASFIAEKCTLPEICKLNIENIKNRKEKIAEKLFHKIDDRVRKKIHAIEPHPDDVLGSASGLCYSNGVNIILHTITKTADERDSVTLGKDIHRKYKSVRKIPNIIEQYKYEMPDLHWDNRCSDTETTYCDLLEQYIEIYGEKHVRNLLGHIESIVEKAKQEEAYVAFPLGIEHPMHVLVTYACVNKIEELDFDREKVIVYVDHPYDFQNAGNGRLMNAKNYIQAELGMKLTRCDDISIDQSILREIITEIYGQKHYGEFGGSLENTFCSYFIENMALTSVKKFLNLHVNNVLYITAQAKPYYKTGGLGEVAYAYCKALKDFVNDVRIMMPNYSGEDIRKDIEDEEKETFEFEYKGNTREIGDINCSIEKRMYHDLIYYLVNVEDYFGKNRFDSGSHGRVFAVFCDVILQKGLNTIDYKPSVLHCNDWQTAMIPMLKKTKYKYFRPELKVIYTVHFYGYKGIFSKKHILEYVGLGKNNCRLCIACNDDCPLNRIDLLSNEDLGKLYVTPSQMSFMKAGIEFADIVSTVSRGYAKEIQKYPDFANVKVVGIRNGISQQRYQFAEDSGFVDIEEKDFRKLKQKNKVRLQEKLGLKQNPEIPVICMVSRLSVVKGIEVVKNIAKEIMEIPAQLVIIGDDDAAGGIGGTGGRPYGNFFEELEKDKSNRGMFAYKKFSEELEYQTYAGSDILLMPSLSEACGTTQMNAMRYGVVPIVSMISAFEDTVLDYKYRDKKEDNEYWDRGIGFYAYKDDCWVLLEVIKKAVDIYRNKDNKETWKEIAEDCTKVNFEWRSRSIKEYLNLYNCL